ncbi:MAG: hypothetical protein QM668_08545 [Agriterribacter sp.]
MGKQTLTVIAYANNSNSMTNDWVFDIKSIVIPEGWRYLNHHTWITTANPNVPESNRWKRSEGAERDKNGQIISLWVKAEAGPRNSFGPHVWIGNGLEVVIER